MRLRRRKPEPEPLELERDEQIADVLERYATRTTPRMKLERYHREHQQQRQAAARADAHTHRPEEPGVPLHHHRAGSRSTAPSTSEPVPSAAETPAAAAQRLERELAKASWDLRGLTVAEGVAACREADLDELDDLPPQHWEFV